MFLDYKNDFVAIKITKFVIIFPRNAPLISIIFFIAGIMLPILSFMPLKIYFFHTYRLNLKTFTGTFIIEIY